MIHTITPEQLKALIAFAEDEKAPFDPDAVIALSYLNGSVQRNAAKRLAAVTRRNEVLTERIERYRSRENSRIETGQFGETGLDSAEVAQALLFQLQHLKTYKLSKGKVIAILYEMYASWLHSKKERLFEEHPVATEYGPQLWRVFKRLNIYDTVPYEDYRALAAKNPAVAAFTKSAAEKYYDYKESDLTGPALKSLPYRNASKEHNDGKWNKEIDDREIYAWKADQNKGGERP